MGLDPKQVFSVSKIAIGNVSAQGLRFLFWLSAIWILTPSEYGLIRYSLTVANFLALPVLTGFSGAITKFISEYGNTEKGKLYALNTILFDALILTLMVILSFVLGIVFPTQIPILSAYMVIVLGLYVMYYSYVRGLMDVNRIVAFGVSVNLIRILFILVFYFLHLFGIFWVLVAFGLPLIFGWPISEIYRTTDFHMYESLPVVDWKTWKRILFFALPGFISGGMWMFIGQIDIVFIRQYLGLSNVAYYSVAKSLASVAGFVTGAIIVLHMPKISSFKGDKKKIYAYTVKSIKMAIYGLLLISLILIASSPLIFSVFPEGYTNSILPFYILIPATIFSGLFALIGATWTGYGKPEKEAQALVFILPLVVALNVLLIPLFGISGAALAYLISELSMFIFIYILFEKNFY